MTDARDGQSEARRVGVLMGGLSAEREVSLDTGAGAARALAERGHDVCAIDWAPGTSLPTLLAEARVDVVWNALHGTYGEDGAVQGLLACLGIPCTGSGVLASALAMDKAASKRIFSSHGLPTPAWRLIETDDPLPDSDASASDNSDASASDNSDASDASDANDASDGSGGLSGWRGPTVVKPAIEGSSVGVTVLPTADAATPAAIRAAIERARQYHGPTIVERYIDGAEIHVGILDGRVLGSIEVRPAAGFYDYQAKYKRDDTSYVIPAELDLAAIAAGEDVARRAYQALGCSGHGRVDLRVDGDGAPWLLEVNTLPGMTSHSLLPKIAAHVGIDYATLCERILASAVPHR